MTAARKVEPSATPALTVASEFGAVEFRALAREAFEKCGAADPSVAAEFLLKSLNNRQCRVALGVTLHGWMRVYGAERDRNARRDDVQVLPAARRTATGPQRVNDWYQRVLSTRLLAGEVWKFLRECDTADLRAAAEIRFNAAAATHAEGERLSSLAALMDDGGYSTVADVPAADLKRIYGATK